ncbi:MAG TPA: exodeoxyribonuclease VII small subunit [Chthoniobacterales bacterium]
MIPPDPDSVPFVEPQDYEDAMARLENIVQRMESGQMPLDQLLACHEEGTKLVAFCQLKLEAAEERIAYVTRRAAETAKTEKARPSSPAPAQKPVRNPSTDVSLF